MSCENCGVPRFLHNGPRLMCPPRETTFAMACKRRDEGRDVFKGPAPISGSPPTPPPDSAPYLRLYKHAGMWVTELWMGDVGSRRSSAYDEFKGTYVGSDTAADALTRGLEMLEAQTTKENRT